MRARGYRGAVEIRIRPARAGEHELLLGIWRRAVEATHHFLTPADIDWYAGLLAGYLPAMSDLRVAEHAERGPVGFLAQENGEIDALFVEPSLHGHGIGTRLLDDVARDHPVLRLDVNEDNPTARKFYAAKGFEEVGRSEIDGQGRPFPLLHLRRDRTSR
ncbi:GNAT family N-acetyltransferase [Nocardia farcinica]|nr:GNAT family N-acetyltransferase [Nocardia farcinica]